MRKLFAWVIVTLLVGCQSTQQGDQVQITTNNDTNTPQSSNIASEVGTSLKKVKHSDVKEGSDASEQPPELSPQEQEDLWQRIAMQLKMPVPDSPKVNYYRKWYIDHPEHFAVIAKRAEPFLYLIVEKIEDKHMPLELALLPVVESAFDAFAYSHGSAAGLWQFVSGTGKMYGLKQNYWYDGRRDVDMATDAALDYLADLNKQFNGNWYHAIAAYNSGGGRVDRAIKKNIKNGKPTDFFSLDLPKETSSYVPKLLALADVVAHQKKYGIDIPAIANHPVLKRVDPEEQLDIALAADYAGLSIKELQSYNPAYNQWATAPQGPHHFLIPEKNVAQFNQAIHDHKGKGVKLVRHKVSSGDTLNLLAQKYNTTTKIIKDSNSLSGNTIRLGQYLMIPTATNNDSKYILSVKNRLLQTQSKQHGQYKLTYKVRSGDNLWNIAKKNGVSYQSLAKWNGMGPKDPLRVGQKLVIWKKGAKGSVIRTVNYKVRSGDTISDIASRFKVRSADIIKWNNLGKNKYIQPGQNITLYVDVTKVSV